ncbi:hypothetical protein D3C76_48170 [compost metagenome]
MAGNFGIGVGAFLSGMNQGIEAGERIGKARDRKALRDIATQGTDAAKAAREADIGKSINVGSTEQNGMTVPTYEVGGQSYESEDAARAAAEKQVGGFMDYYAKTVLPKYQEHWMQTGEVEKAQAIDKWMQDQNVQKGVKAWANAVRSFQTGDREGFKNNLMAAYNQQGYYQDGMTATAIEDVSDDKGNLIGYKISFKDPKGKVTTQTYDGDDVARLGLNALSPAEVLSYGVNQLKQAQTARADLAKEDRKFKRDVALKKLEQGQRLESQGNESQLRMAEKAEERRTGGSSTKVRDAEAVGAWLKQQGYSDDFIRSQAPRLVGLEAQQMSPQNRLNSILETLNKSLDFQDLPDDQKVQKAYDVMKMQDGLLASRTPATTPQAQSAPVQSGRGIPVWDNKTNSLTYR